MAQDAMQRSGFQEIRLEKKGPVGQDSPRVYGRPPQDDAKEFVQRMRKAGVLVAEENGGIWIHPQMLTWEQMKEVCRAVEEQAVAEKEE